MTADDNDLFGFLAAPKLADDVCGLDIWFEVRLHLQPDDNAPAPLDHPLQTIGVFAGNRSGRHLRHSAGVLQVSGMRTTLPGRPYRSNEHRDRPVPRRF